MILSKMVLIMAESRFGVLKLVSIEFMFAFYTLKTTISEQGVVFL